MLKDPGLQMCILGNRGIAYHMAQYQYPVIIIHYS